MHIFRYQGSQGPRLGADIEGQGFDLSAVAPELADISSWLALPDPVAAVHENITRLRSFPISGPLQLLAPLDLQEVWACGVTYLRSKVARMEESAGGGNCYDQVYLAERPEIFFKATPCRVVGPGRPIRIRRDSAWNVPEPELVLVLSSRGMIVGYTIGNDVSSRSIEGENPLYLPQAKVYDGCCALGPVIALAEGGPAARGIHITIHRGGVEVFNGETSTGRMRRTPEELASWLFRELTFETGAFLLTGTGIVPPGEFTLLSGDRVRIAIEGIGVLENPVA